MVTTKYEIGQQLWWPRPGTKPTSVECPHCGGTGRLRVTFHDETTVSVDCQNCSLGYEPPTGRITVYERSPEAQLVEVRGFEVHGDGTVEYRTSGSYVVKEGDLFETREEALARCVERNAEMEREELAKIATKEKDTRSWAWNASYHRNQIKRAQQQIDYHTRKLNVANLKAKEQKARARGEEDGQ